MGTPIVRRDRTALDRLLDPSRNALTPDAARAIVDLRADAATQARIDDLAERHHEGLLTEAELAEYQSLVDGINLVSIPQAKVRSVLKREAWGDRSRASGPRMAAGGRTLRMMNADSRVDLRREIAEAGG